MPSFMGLRSRPATSGGTAHRRHSSILLDNPKRDDGKIENTHKSKGSLQRLSLSFNHREENTFGSLFTQDPEEMSIHRTSGEEQPQSQGQTSDGEVGSTHFRVTEPTQLQQDAPASLGREFDQVRRERSVKPQRFSLLKFRHASDPQLSTRYKDPVKVPSEPLPTPKIITTAPTSHHLDEPIKKRPKKTVLGRSLSPFRKSTLIREQGSDGSGASEEVDGNKAEGVSSTPNLGKQNKIHFGPFNSKDNQPAMQGPPAYGDESNSALAIPISRLSESGGSEGSSGDHKLYARTTTTISTTTTFFKLKRKKKDKGHLFPLPERFPRPSSDRTSIAGTGEGSRRSISPGRRSNQAVRFEHRDSGEISLSPTHSLTAITNAPLGSPGPAIVRKHSTLSAHSGASTPSLLPPRLSARGRSSTMGSLGKSSDREGDGTPQATASSRTSTSTSGRRSFGDLLLFSHRMRQNSIPPRNGSTNSPSTPGSKSNSMQINREAEPEISYPAREESDTPATYLEKLEAAVQRGSLATILCKTADDFSKTCLRKYMRGFSYFGESIDMSIRKMLMEVELPKETQQIDRLLGGFADRYHECNPGIFVSADEASIVAFSILLLHSDNHNKNNKRKMQKHDYVKNTQHGRVSVSGDVLECFYDNICYTPFIHFDDEIAINSHRLAAPRPKKNLIRTKSSEVVIRGQVDPYTLILDNKLELLRPTLKEVIETEDTYSSMGTLKNPNPNDHHKAFSHSSVLQIVSARSRPDAFATQATISNPLEAQAGLVSIKVAKVGLLWRKDIRKKKAKRPWQEWGAILTDSKLYFFRDVGWVKKLMSQYETHSKQTGRVGSLIFKPALTSFEPDALMAMDDAVVLLDSSYKKHKNAFTFIKHGGFEEVFLANSEPEMNDWIGKLNYAATFRTAGVRLRGLLGTTYEGKHLLRKNSELSTMSSEVGASDNLSSIQKGVDPSMAWEIMFYRRQLISEKISNLDDRLAVAQKELDQLLRNARHLLLLLPVQQKTREALVLAAGRMSAKLKWTRVETWRSKTHRDILIKDLEAEANSAFPHPAAKSPAETPKVTPKRTGQQTVQQRSDSTPSNLALSPTVTTSGSMRRPSQTVLDHIKTSDLGPEEHITHRSSQSGPMTPSPKTSSFVTSAELSPKRETHLESPLLRHNPSIVSSHRSRQEEDLMNAAQGDDGDDEERILKEAGLATVEGDVHNDSDKDRMGPTSPAGPETPSPREHRASVRRSLQRTLREGPHVHRLSSHHQRKGKESGSSIVNADDRHDATGGDGLELKRGAGSFILHGKKASVIVMSPELQSMAVEERLKRRPEPMAEEKEMEGQDVKEAVFDNDVDKTPRQSAVNVSPLTSPEKEAFHSAPSSRKPSISSSLTESEGGPEEEELWQGRGKSA